MNVRDAGNRSIPGPASPAIPPAPVAVPHYSIVGGARVVRSVTRHAVRHSLAVQNPRIAPAGIR